MKRILLVIGVVLTALPLGSQAQTPAAERWTPPRTHDGQPDLQGIWTTQTYTPLQRPQRYAGRQFLTEEEATELIKLLTQLPRRELRLGEHPQWRPRH